MRSWRILPSRENQWLELNRRVNDYSLNGCSVGKTVYSLLVLFYVPTCAFILVRREGNKINYFMGEISNEKWFLIT